MGGLQGRSRHVAGRGHLCLPAAGSVAEMSRASDFNSHSCLDCLHEVTGHSNWPNGLADTFW